MYKGLFLLFNVNVDRFNVAKIQVFESIIQLVNLDNESWISNLVFRILYIEFRVSVLGCRRFKIQMWKVSFPALARAIIMMNTNKTGIELKTDPELLNCDTMDESWFSWGCRHAKYGLETVITFCGYEKRDPSSGKTFQHPIDFKIIGAFSGIAFVLIAAYGDRGKFYLLLKDFLYFLS